MISFIFKKVIKMTILNFIFRIFSGFLGGFWRRLFGGYDSKFDFLESRGVQLALCVVPLFFYEWLFKHETWYISIVISVLVYIFWCKGHWYYFQCGTESDAYIDEQMAKGRKPAMNWLVAPINKWLGFEPRSKQYCFVGLFLRYFLWSLPVGYFVGWQFIVCGFAIPFIYNACFWVQFPNCKLAKCPTNWAEIFNGIIIAWGVM